ncbi:hypothetical protein [Viridibacterium curvum]|uniref:Uncharacterized protein n=1 Tax=Viridibacterium curvum TaxID=1101404 RepID=A0ABP9QMP0_9RHOO
MASFKETFAKIEAAIGDLTSLEVTTYKGTINIKKTIDAKPADNKELDFSDILKQLTVDGADIQLVASTLSRLDGDTTAFIDKNASAAELTAHAQLLDSANAKRNALIQVIEAAVSGVVKR